MRRRSSFILSFRIKCIYFSLQRFFNQEFIWASIFSKFLLSPLIIMFEKLSAVSVEMFLTLLTIFLTLRRRLTLLARSLLPTCTIHYSGFRSRKSSILSTMSPLVAPGIFKTSASLIWILQCRPYYLT